MHPGQEAKEPQGRRTPARLPTGTPIPCIYGPYSHRTWTPVPRTWTRTSRTWTQVPRTWTQMSRTWTQVPRTWTQTSRTWTQVPRTWTQMSRTWTQVSRTWTQMSQTWTQTRRTWTQNERGTVTERCCRAVMNRPETLLSGVRSSLNALQRRWGGCLKKRGGGCAKGIGNSPKGWVVTLGAAPTN